VKSRGVLTTINIISSAVAARHATLAVKAQAQAAGLPSGSSVALPCSNEVYEEAMFEACASAVQQSIPAWPSATFSLRRRRYREDRCATGTRTMFPLWYATPRMISEC